MLFLFLILHPHRHLSTPLTKTLPVIVPQPPQRPLRRGPQVRQVRRVAVRGLVPDVDQQGRQADLVRLRVHGDFVLGFLLRVQEAGDEAGSARVLG